MLKHFCPISTLKTSKKTSPAQSSWKSDCASPAHFPDFLAGRSSAPIDDWEIPAIVSAREPPMLAMCCNSVSQKWGYSDIEKTMLENFCQSNMNKLQHIFFSKNILNHQIQHQTCKKKCWCRPHREPFSKSVASDRPCREGAPTDKGRCKAAKPPRSPEAGDDKNTRHNLIISDSFYLIYLAISYDIIYL